jgi:O-antigen/teichoic acid export membrane protein
MHIDRKDVLWNYAATFLRIGANILLLPFTLRMLPPETYGLWTLFSAISALVNLLDFGFNPSFTRNVTYIFSGAKKLKESGFDTIEENTEIDYSLLKSLISAMRFFYSRAAAIMFFSLAVFGTYYIYIVTANYTQNKNEAYAAWFIFCIVNTWSFYTFYYEALLQGKGLIKQAKQIIVAGETAYMIIAVVFIQHNFGLTGLACAQGVSVIIRRILAHKVFYTKELSNKLSNCDARKYNNIIKIIYPNALKLGAVGIGGFIVTKAAAIAGAFYLPLETVASYGITAQITAVIGALAGLYVSTYIPQIAEFRLSNNLNGIKKIYIKHCGIMLAVFFIFGAGLLLFGEGALEIIGSRTPLLSKPCVILFLCIMLLETNHAAAANILATKNEVPFFKASLFSGAFTIFLLFIFLHTAKIGVWGMMLAPGIAQAVYNNWKYTRNYHAVSSWSYFDYSGMFYVPKKKVSFKSIAAYGFIMGRNIDNIRIWARKNAANIGKNTGCDTIMDNVFNYGNCLRHVYGYKKNKQAYIRSINT